MTRSKKSWSELSPTQQKAVVVAGVAEMVMTAWALNDLRRRPGSEVRGPKPVWALACFVQPVGPLSYLLIGRRRHA